jgi:hypothetical protein
VKDGEEIILLGLFLEEDQDQVELRESHLGFPSRLWQLGDIRLYWQAGWYVSATNGMVRKGRAKLHVVVDDNAMLHIFDSTAAAAGETSMIRKEDVVKPCLKSVWPRQNWERPTMHIGGSNRERIVVCRNANGFGPTGKFERSPLFFCAILFVCWPIGSIPPRRLPDGEK